MRWWSCHMDSGTGRGVTTDHCLYRNAAGALLLALLAVSATVSIAPIAADAAEPGASAASTTTQSAAIEEWLNQKVRLHDTVQALDRPVSNGKPAGEIRAGAEVEAIGLVAGKHWVRIELPDHSLVYVPREAIEFENDAAAPAVTKSAAGSPAAPSPSAPSPGGQKPRAAEVASRPGPVRGAVTKVPNAATLVVADQRLRLSGVDPGPPKDLQGFESWVRGQGALLCEPDAQTGRYRCFTGAGVDVAEAAILNGAGRVGEGASPAYRDSETAARQGKRGLWGQP
ncbi:MAG: thermonuclease family protein [Stellaceae bacterium]